MKMELVLQLKHFLDKTLPRIVEISGHQLARKVTLRKVILSDVISSLLYISFTQDSGLSISPQFLPVLAG